MDRDWSGPGRMRASEMFEKGKRALIKRGARAESCGGTDVVDKRVYMVRVIFAA